MCSVMDAIGKSFGLNGSITPESARIADLERENKKLWEQIDGLKRLLETIKIWERTYRLSK